MPRPRKQDGREPKSRSRNGCWSCKARKVKCTEERPSCSKCLKGGYHCDYGIRLNWDGRRSKRPQLKAVHLDTFRLMTTDGPETSGLDGNNLNMNNMTTMNMMNNNANKNIPDTDVFSVNSSNNNNTSNNFITKTAHRKTTADPTETTVDPAAVSPLSSGSSSSVSASPMAKPGFDQLTFMPLEMPMSVFKVNGSSNNNIANNSNNNSNSNNITGNSTNTTTTTTTNNNRTSKTKTAPPTQPGKNAIDTPPEDDDGPFRILSPMLSTTSPTTFQFEIRAGGPTSRRPAKTKPPPVSATSTTTRPSSVSSNAALTVQTSTAASEEGSSLSDSARKTAKRPRLDSDVSERDFAWTWPMSPSTASGSLSAASPRNTTSSSRHDNGMTNHSSPEEGPLMSPSSTSGGAAGASAFLNMATASDFHRLSVNSLLSVPLNEAIAATSSLAGNDLASSPPLLTSSSQDNNGNNNSSHRSGRHDHSRSYVYYGIDGGFIDQDLGKNDDANALTGIGRSNNNGKTGHGGYYDRPVTVRIHRALGPLPSKLTENPMNMLYFHHFINHTARVLVPHDDPKSNPFRTILPQMALKNDNLLSLLLAYSASHRARVLDHTEPGMRIALWVQDIFPALRKALEDHKQKISNANVATAIMLASLAIVSPTAFGYNIPWQKHLMLARQLIAARPEGLRVDHHSSLEGQVCSFLWSWFAYLDVLGGLSGGPTDASPAWILDYKVYDPADDDEIDCIMGFTTRCVYILSQIAELVRFCEPERLRILRKDPDGWIPSMDLEQRVVSLEVDVRDSMTQKPRACSHLHRSGDVVRWDAQEMSATNEAYHWAALVHLHRRVLGKPSDHPDVAVPVQHIILCLDRVRVGGTAENCLLFPLFTAGCECSDPDQRKSLLQRMQIVEGIGMMQVTRARALMQKTWGMGKLWETLLTSEFIG